MISKPQDAVPSSRIWTLGRRLPPADPESGKADWIQAQPPWIRQELEHALSLPSGGWFVVDASRRIGARPTCYFVDGQELVAWRAQGSLRMAPNACPHMGAPLSAGPVRDGKLVCPWHGLALGSERHGAWHLLETHDDGVLTWVRPGAADPAFPRPVLPQRPRQFVDGVIRMVARCEPADVIANRLDPWHGVYFHPHSFARLRILSREGHRILLRVAFRVAGPVCVEVDASFHCPEPRTIVMTIVEGEGQGSVVETHATPLAPGWTAIVEATLATSNRPGFHLATRWLGALFRPLIERAARRLWVEDAAYAERSHFLRRGVGAVTIDSQWWRQAPGTPRPR
jgi:hypothetical protein